MSIDAGVDFELKPVAKPEVFGRGAPIACSSFGGRRGVRAMANETGGGRGSYVCGSNLSRAVADGSAIAAQRGD